MARSTSNTFGLFLFGLALLMSVSSGYGQQIVQSKNQTKIDEGKEKSKKEAKKDTIPVYNGLSIGTNLIGLAEMILPSKMISPEISVQAILFRKLFPTLELGLTTGTAPIKGGGGYQIGTAPFFRVGADYKIIGSDDKNLFYIGLRYGVSPFRYSITGAVAQNEYWGQTTPFGVIEKSTVEQWAEAVGGLKVSLSPLFAMGWNVRYRFLLPNGSTESLRPSFIPGFGLRSVNNDCISIQYCIYFRL